MLKPERENLASLKRHRFEVLADDARRPVHIVRWRSLRKNLLWPNHPGNLLNEIHAVQDFDLRVQHPRPTFIRILHTNFGPNRHDRRRLHHVFHEELGFGLKHRLP